MKTVDFIADNNKWRHIYELIDNDIFTNSIIKVYVNSILPPSDYNNTNEKKIFMQTEPRSLQHSTLSWVEKNSDKFDLILAHDEILLKKEHSLLFQPYRKYFRVNSPLNSNLLNIFHKHNKPHFVNINTREINYKNKNLK